MQMALITTTSGILALVAFGVAGPHRAAARSSAALRLTVQVTHVFDGAPLRFDDVSLRNRAGEMLSVSRLAYLVSDVALLRPDGTELRLDGPAAYLNPAEQRNSLIRDDVPAGHYAGISFRIGLDPQTNHRDPSGYPAGDPLHPLVNHLHWGWQGGYVFLALEGRFEQPGGRLGGYSYHLANDENRMQVLLRKDVQLEGDAVLGLRFDVARIFAASHRIAIRSPGAEGPLPGDSTHSAAGDALARQLKTNIERAFTLTGVTADPASSPSATPVGVPAPRPPGTTPFDLRVPPHFPQPRLPADNPLTVEGVALGEKLFFEKRLSGNDTQTCASCHRPERAFADEGHAFSLGSAGQPGARNAMSLCNLAWSDTFTWDGRRTRLRDQALAPIQDAREMRQSLAQTVAKLRADGEYPALFDRAFGNAGITAERLGLALEQYLYTLVSADAKFDRALRGEAPFSDEEKRGLQLFITEYDPARGRQGADCFHCHGGNLFTDFQYHNNGLDSASDDRGRAAVTGREADRGKFKTPSLRNVAVTGPYMHDGRFPTLEAVVDHYSSGIHRSETLDPNIAKHPEEGMALSAADKQALVAFLKTLTDARFQPAS